MSDTAVFDPAEIVSEPLGVEIAELMEEMAQRPQAGEVVGEVGGMKVKQTKNKSLVTYNGVELPERTRVFDKNGVPSLVPTAQLAYHLSKKTIDGERAFYSKVPAGVTPPVPIDEKCEWCSNKNRKFFSEWDLEIHQQYLHPLEYASKQRKEDRASRSASVQDILKLVASLTPEQRQALIGEQP